MIKLEIPILSLLETRDQESVVRSHPLVLLVKSCPGLDIVRTGAGCDCLGPAPGEVRVRVDAPGEVLAAPGGSGEEEVRLGHLVERGEVLVGLLEESVDPQHVGIPDRGHSAGGHGHSLTAVSHRGGRSAVQLGVWCLGFSFDLNINLCVRLVVMKELRLSTPVSDHLPGLLPQPGHLAPGHLEGEKEN